MLLCCTVLFANLHFLLHQLASCWILRIQQAPTCCVCLQGALANSLWVAVVVVLVRLLAVACGSWVACTVSGAKLEQRRVFWMSMVTQVRLAMLTICLWSVCSMYLQLFWNVHLTVEMSINVVCVALRPVECGST